MLPGHVALQGRGATEPFGGGEGDVQGHRVGVGVLHQHPGLDAARGAAFRQVPGVGVDGEGDHHVVGFPDVGDDVGAGDGLGTPLSVMVAMW